MTITSISQTFLINYKVSGTINQSTRLWCERSEHIPYPVHPTSLLLPRSFSSPFHSLRSVPSGVPILFHTALRRKPKEKSQFSSAFYGDKGFHPKIYPNFAPGNKIQCISCSISPQRRETWRLQRKLPTRILSLSSDANRSGSSALWKGGFPASPQAARPHSET